MQKYTVLSGAVDAILLRKSFAAHDAYFDVESTNTVGTHSLVFRSNDKTIIGRTKTPAAAELVWNDDTGAAVPFPLVQSSDYKALSDARDQLIAFYSSTDAFSVRLAPLGEIATAVLPLVMAIFGATTYRDAKTEKIKNGWKLGSYHAIRDTAGQRGNKRQLAERVVAHHDDIKRQLAALRELVRTLTSQQAAAPLPMSAATQATIDATVASAFEPAVNMSMLREELSNPTEGMEARYGAALEHISDDPSAEPLYLEALEESDDTTDFAARIEKILAGRAVLA